MAVGGFEECVHCVEGAFPTDGYITSQLVRWRLQQPPFLLRGLICCSDSPDPAEPVRHGREQQLR